MIYRQGVVQLIFLLHGQQPLGNIDTNFFVVAYSARMKWCRRKSHG